jgi:hypothetical protein
MNYSEAQRMPNANPTPDEICERLREADRNSVQRCLGSRIFAEAAALIQQQQATIERLSAALAFYADERNWRSVTVYMCGHGEIDCAVMADKGSKARTALGKDASDVRSPGSSEGE